MLTSKQASKERVCECGLRPMLRWMSKTSASNRAVRCPGCGRTYEQVSSLPLEFFREDSKGNWELVDIYEASG